MLFRRFPWKKIHVRSIATSVKTSRKTQTRAAAKASKSLLLSFLFSYFISAAALLLLKDIFSLFLYLLLNWKLNTANIRAPAVDNFHCNKYSATSFALLLLSLFIMMTMRVTKEMSMYKKSRYYTLRFWHACLHASIVIIVITYHPHHQQQHHIIIIVIISCETGSVSTLKSTETEVASSIVAWQQAVVWLWVYPTTSPPLGGFMYASSSSSWSS